MYSNRGDAVPGLQLEEEPIAENRQSATARPVVKYALRKGAAVLLLVPLIFGFGTAAARGVSLNWPLEAEAAAMPTATPASVSLPPFEPQAEHPAGITRRANLRTVRPERPRFAVYRYTVQKGDSPWGIAEKFDLAIESILWGNEGMSADAGGLQPEQVINILPVDGVLHTVVEGDTLNRLKILHGTAIEDIQEFIGNRLEGLATDAPLPVGQQIIVPGGTNPVIWQEPGPAVLPGKGRSSPGFYSGPLGVTGTGYFAWPANPVVITQPYWGSHPAIDIDTYYRQPIFASDSGTVIFSGWSNTGYGNLIIIDHGNGYWTYYAHNAFNLVQQGQGVLQGEQIAESGNTGNSTGDHLDFRIRVAEGSFLNPSDFLP